VLPTAEAKNRILEIQEIRGIEGELGLQNGVSWGNENEKMKRARSVGATGLDGRPGLNLSDQNDWMEDAEGMQRIRDQE
jgi:hypothetical protein